MALVRLVAGAALLSLSGVFVALAGVEATRSALWRNAYALPVLPVLLALVARRVHRDGSTPTTKLAVPVAAVGLLEGAEVVAYHAAVDTVGVGAATVLVSLQPLCVAGLAGTVLGERPQARSVVAAPVAIVGVGLLSIGATGPATADVRLLGTGLGIGAAVLYAAYLVGLRAFRRHLVGPGQLDARRRAGARRHLARVASHPLSRDVSQGGARIVAWGADHARRQEARVARQPTTCQEPDCTRAGYSRGWCELHYRRWLRTGSPTRGTRPKTCEVDGCGRDAKSRGWCHGHYQRWRTRGDVRANVPLRAAGACSAPGCDRKRYARGYCATHYRRVRSTGSARPDEPIRVVTGGGYEHHGYCVVPVPPEDRWLVGGQTSALEHRFVMARMLERPLYSDENVHHVNGDRLDNRPDNLELWSTSQPRGQRVGDKVEHAIAIIGRYLPHRLRPDTELPRAETDPG